MNGAQLRELKEQAESFTFQAEVNRMMKLIINSLYRNKEVNIFYEHYLNTNIYHIIIFHF